MLKITFKIFLIIIILSIKTSFSQERFNYKDIHLRANIQRGLLLFEYDFFNYIINDNIHAIELSIHKELKGDRDWQRLYNYPSVGISTFYTTLGNNDVYGKAFALQPFIKFKWFKYNKFNIENSIGIGGSYATKIFNLETNYQNIAIASHMNFWFNAELIAKYSVYKNVSLYAGTAFSHLSNANLSEPNIGLNTWNFIVGTDILLTKKEDKNINPIPDFTNKNFYYIVAAGGIKHTRRFARILYFSSSIDFGYSRKISHKFTIGGGADVFYDNSVIPEMIRFNKKDIKNSDNFKTGLHLSQEIIFGDVSFTIQEGIYIGLVDNLNNHKFYNRGVIRYKFSNHFFANAAMKTNVLVLDVMELGFGYCIN